MLKRSEEHTSELQAHSFISYAVFCLKKKNVSGENARCVWFTIQVFSGACGGVRVTSPLCTMSPRNQNASPASATFFVFFFNDTATTEIYTLSLHDALPISSPAANSLPLTSSQICPRSRG